MTAHNFIMTELIDLGIPNTSYAWQYLYGSASDVSGKLTRTELREYIEEQMESLPLDYFDSNSDMLEVRYISGDM